MAANLQPKSAERILYRSFLILTLTATGMATLLALLPPAGHDQIWFLLMADRWLGAAHSPGAPLYGPQLFDSNPPAIIWLSALPILLARALHVSSTFAAKLLTILSESSASLLSLYFLRRARPIRARYEPLALLVAAFILFYLAPARDFGQRDQILSFLTLPYILAAALDPAIHRLTFPRCIAALMAATGICLKPHHSLVIIAVEATLLLVPNRFSPRRDQMTQGFSLGSHTPVLKEGAGSLRPQPQVSPPHRLLRPEPILITLLGLLYLAAIHRLTPLYFSLALPTLRDT
jgi:hypothetical protein